MKVRSVSIVLAATVAATCAFTPLPAQAPDSYPGLVAWYTVDSLHKSMREGETLTLWGDSSGNGHDLQDDGSKRTTFHTNQVNGYGAVVVGKASTFVIAEPFELDDHTIFVVYRAARARRALFRSERAGEESRGVVLRQDGARDVLQLPGGHAPYGRDGAMPEGFTLAVLGREAGRLHQSIDGVEVSSGAELLPPLRVGLLFDLTHTTYVDSDGQGLSLAELIFFDRFLGEEERADLTAYLAEKYGLSAPVAVRARLGDAAAAVLSTSSGHDTNDPRGYTIPWNLQHRLDPPFRHDPESDATRLWCTADGTRIQLHVSLPLERTALGADVRVLLLKNGEDYLDQETSSGPLDDDGEPPLLELTAELTLNAGESIEVVTAGEAEPGSIRLIPERAQLRAEVIIAGEE